MNNSKYSDAVLKKNPQKKKKRKSWLNEFLQSHDVLQFYIMIHGETRRNIDDSMSFEKKDALRTWKILKSQISVGMIYNT